MNGNTPVAAGTSTPQQQLTATTISETPAPPIEHVIVAGKEEEDDEAWYEDEELEDIPSEVYVFRTTPVASQVVKLLKKMEQG